ncbi:hypothetical protein B0T16DRAFT_321149 [Cercophora newfieldiana]|uniref:Uncharacterized protein n=1 Tax=Cercophora newfieldiana TaxID=92897 RepID=A0AA40CTL0_9PEZI|nr:hypothetical protein B0T16DRAFT_321149 [Cercophora newfieldiana]
MTSERRDAIDVERSGALPELLPELLAPENPPGWLNATKAPRVDKAGNVCFVCLDRPRHGQYALRVPCLKPKAEREIRVFFAKDEADDGSRVRVETQVYARMEAWEKMLEDDRGVYARMVGACFQDLGKWKRLLPYYGVVSVAEVMFHFDGRISRDGRLGGLIVPVNLEKTREDCQEAIKNCPIPEDSNGWDACDGERHAERCQMAMEHSWSECLTVEADRAEKRLWRMDQRYLLTRCARDPLSANGLHTLSGMAQESCIYPVL